MMKVKTLLENTKNWKLKLRDEQEKSSLLLAKKHHSALSYSSFRLVNPAAFEEGLNFHIFCPSNPTNSPCLGFRAKNERPGEVLHVTLKFMSRRQKKNGGPDGLAVTKRFCIYSP